MANGYNVCPTCGCPTHPQLQGQQFGPPQWQGPQYCPPQYGPPQWQQPWMGPAWGGPGAGYGAGYATPAYGPGYGSAQAPAYYGGLPTDSEIEEMIYDSIDSDPLIPFDANIDISVEAGTVYLRGEVTSKRVKHAAGDDAWWIPGVIDVHNEIKVAPRKRSKPGEGAQMGAEQQQD